MIQVLKAMIVREIQEHKVAFVYAPFFVSIILCLVIASVYFGGTNIQTDQFNFSTEYYDEEIRQAMQSVSSVSRIDIVRTGLLVLGFPILLTVGFGLLANNPNPTVSKIGNPRTSKPVLTISILDTLETDCIACLISSS